MKRIISGLLFPVIFFIFAFWILAIKNGYILRWFDEISLFQSGADYFRQFLHYPGGIFKYAGIFLTQFLYYPVIGACILILIWFICVRLSAVSFRFSGSTAALCYLVPFCLLVSIVHLDEASLTFESQGYVFYNSIGFTFTLGAFALFTALREYKYLRAALTVILPLLYPFAGFFSLLAAAMCIISLVIGGLKENKILSLVSAALSILLIVTVPLLYYRYMEGTTADNDYLYLKGLPELTMNDYDLYLWRPFAVASLLLILFVLISRFVDYKKTAGSPIIRWCSLATFAVGLLLCLSADGKKSEQFRATVLMINAIEERNWSKVSHVMAATKESPNYTMCVLNNLALAFTGRSPLNLGNMMAVNSDFRHNEEFSITAFVNVPVNHYMGRFNQSHRWATEHNVQYGNRAYFIKYIVRNAIMNGDTAFATKFNRMLKQTMFHRKWAEEMDKYIENPSLLPTLPDYDMIMRLRAEEIKRGE